MHLWHWFLQNSLATVRPSSCIGALCISCLCTVPFASPETIRDFSTPQLWKISTYCVLQRPSDCLHTSRPFPLVVLASTAMLNALCLWFCASLSCYTSEGYGALLSNWHFRWLSRWRGRSAFSKSLWLFDASPLPSFFVSARWTLSRWVRVRAFVLSCHSEVVLIVFAQWFTSSCEFPSRTMSPPTCAS